MPHASIDTHVKNAQPRLSREGYFVVIPKKYLDDILAELCAPRRSFVGSISGALSSAFGSWLRLLAGYMSESGTVAKAGVAARGVASTTAGSNTRANSGKLRANRIRTWRHACDLYVGQELDERALQEPRI